MTREWYRNLMLTLIAISLLVLSVRPAATGQTEPVSKGDWYVEPRTFALPVPEGIGQVQGKVMIDLRSGDVWGFPTNSMLPYPADPLRREPRVVKPVYLGRFDLAAARRQ